MPVKRCTLDGLRIQSMDDLYDQLALQLSFPDHFGRNLDALRDVLSTDIKGPFEIVWKNATVSGKAMKKDFDRAVRLFKDLEDDRGDFTFKTDK